MRSSMKTRLFRRRSAGPRQRVFAFVDRTRRRERIFKRVILLATGLVIFMILRVVPWGRYLAASITTSSRRATRMALGLPSRRAEIDESWRDFRRLGIEVTRGRIEQFYAGCDPAGRRLMRYAGMDPQHGLLRWANYNWTVLLPSKVFEADEQGRSYRFRPSTRSIWLTKVPINSGLLTFFIVPDGPGLAEVIKGTPIVALESSRQTTNSWGLRGPEPDRDAPLRGLILGDSFMQGMFIGDDETPPECAAPIPRGPAEDEGLDPEYGRAGLLAGAILLHADGVRRAVPAALRGRQRLCQRRRQRLRRVRAGARGTGRRPSTGWIRSSGTAGPAAGPAWSWPPRSGSA